MFLFLQGPPRTGKSTMLRNALLPCQTMVAGLMVQRLFEDGQPCGFRACPVDGTALPALEGRYNSSMPGIFLYAGKADPAILEDAIARAGVLCKQDCCKLIILDEIGGLELASASFMKALDTILRLGKPCLGVIKSAENLAQTAKRLNLPSGILRQNELLRKRLNVAGSVLDVDSGNLDATARAVQGFVAKAVAL